MNIKTLLFLISLISVAQANDSYHDKFEVHAIASTGHAMGHVADPSPGVMVVYNDGPFSTSYIACLQKEWLFIAADFTVGESFHICPGISLVNGSICPMPWGLIRLDMTDSISLTFNTKVGISINLTKLMYEL